MPDRKRKVKFIYVVIAVGCSAVACVCLHLGMHGIVINYGIRFYRSLRNILFCISAVISVAVTALYVSDTVKQRKWQNARDEEAAKAEMMRQEALREQEKHREVLSVSKKMDSEKIRGLLREYAGLEKDVVVIGASDRAEIWDAKRWAADNEDLTADQMAELMDSLNF